MPRTSRNDHAARKEQREAAHASAPELSEITREDIAEMIRVADIDGREFVEIRFHRPGPLKGKQTLRLFGTRGGPESCADTVITEVEPQIFTAKWRTADLRLGLKPKAPTGPAKRGRPISIKFGRGRG